MYTIIGGDGKEYGPASVEQIRSWIVAGRADGNTRAKKEGTQEWRRLADIPEFQPGGLERSAAAEPPPVFSRDFPEAAAAPSPVRAARPIDIGDCFERGWNLLRAHFWPMVGVCAIFVVIAGAEVVSWPVKGLMFVFGGAIQAGMYYFFLKAARGQPATIADAFSGFGPRLPQLILVWVVMMALITVGLFCLILPGVYLLVSYMFAPLLVLDRKMDFWSAMELSRKTVGGQWWHVFGLFLVAMLFGLVGMAVLLVGVFITVPIVFGAVASAYEDLFP